MPDLALALRQAAAAGDEATIRQVLQSRPGLVHAAERASGDSALHCAAQHGQVGAIAALVLAGASLTARNRDGADALALAAAAGHLVAVRALLDWGAQVDSPDCNGRTALHRSAGKAYVGVVQLLLGAGASPFSASSTGSTPLHAAAGAFSRPGQPDVISALIAAAGPEGGAALARARDAAGRTACHIAAAFGDEVTVQQLLAAGADAAAADRDGDSPLHACVSGWQDEEAQRYLGTAEALLATGAGPEALNCRGESPLSIAGFKGVVPLERLLLEAVAQRRVAEPVGTVPAGRAPGQDGPICCRPQQQGGSTFGGVGPSPELSPKDMQPPGLPAPNDAPSAPLLPFPRRIAADWQTSGPPVPASAPSAPPLPPDLHDDPLAWTSPEGREAGQGLATAVGQLPSAEAPSAAASPSEVRPCPEEK